jgi:sensor histidine kinase regulating citrate/malate metabolism
MSTFASILIGIMLGAIAVLVFQIRKGYIADQDGDMIPDAVEDKVAEIKEEVAEKKAAVKKQVKKAKAKTAAVKKEVADVVKEAKDVVEVVKPKRKYTKRAKKA